ncbi:MAG TPA: BTAD domain-containing putative transcriptional regulator [Anaerolineales bacterium]|nr:BTAD domain-containing putative transcriptional regulator [Anaerolineales bacterium]
MSRLNIDALGSLTVTLDARPLTGLDTKKVRALLVLLALESQRAHARSALCGQLWPEHDERAARASLSQAVSQLRLALGDKGAERPFLLVTPDSIQLNPEADVRLDVAVFLDAIRRAEQHNHRSWRTCGACASDLERALALYRGDFLDHFFLNDSTPFEEWSALWRERLRARALSALERLAERAEWIGDFGLAGACTTRMIALDPLSETARREQMRHLALNGEWAAAEAQYDQLRRMLSTEFQTEPEAASLALHRRVRARDLTGLRLHGPAPGLQPFGLGPLIGRSREREAVRQLLENSETRVVTVTGAPGLGKTRLAFEVAYDLRHAFEHGVLVVELAPLTSADLVPAAIAAVLGVKEQARQSLAESLGHFLRDRHLLIVLDNAEHLLDAAPTIASLAASGAGVHFLVTSRAPLRIRAEHLYALDPMAADEAQTLFRARARSAAPEWAMDGPAAADIAAICAQVDHVPLAIELVASRARSLALGELRQQLSRGLSSLGAGSRDLPERQRTLHASIAWSYDRLPDEAQRVLNVLSVFAGGFTSDAARAVAGDASTGALEQLLETSLVTARGGPDEIRFGLLETVREFGAARLRACDDVTEIRDRHLVYYVALAERAYVELIGPEQARWGQRVFSELDNLRAAVAWARHQDRVEPVLRIATGVFRFFWQRGLMREGLSWFEPALAQRQAAPLDVQSRALRTASVLAWSLSDYARAVAWSEAAIDTGRQAGSADLNSAAMTNLGLVLKEQGEWERANAILAEAVALNRAIPDQPHRVKFALVIRAGLLLRLGDWVEAEKAYAEALSHNRTVGDVEGTANALYGLAVTASLRGEIEQARRLCAESLALYTSLNHQYGIGWVHYHWGMIELNAGELGRADALLEHSLGIWLAREDEANTAHVLDGLAQVLGRRECWGPAAQWLCTAERIRLDCQATLTPFETRQRVALIEQARAALGPDAFETACAIGRARHPSEWASMG